MATYTQRKEPKRPIDHVHDQAVKKQFLDADTENWPLCTECDEPFNPKRKELGYVTCLSCGSPRKKFAVVPVPKSNYTVATNVEQLRSPYSHKGNKGD